MSGYDNRNKSDLNNAGNVLGSLYNTNQYSSGYKEKKGMKSPLFNSLFSADSPLSTGFPHVRLSP